LEPGPLEQGPIDPAIGIGPNLGNALALAVGEPIECDIKPGRGPSRREIEDMGGEAAKGNLQAHFSKSPT
jgi:hypothetical protein